MHRTLRALFGQALLALILSAPAAQAGELQVHVIDVDQGSAAFVLGPNGTRVLIDGGAPGAGCGCVRPYLLALDVTDLFCCKGCVKKFEKEPAKYLTKLRGESKTKVEDTTKKD